MLHNEFKVFSNKYAGNLVEGFISATINGLKRPGDRMDESVNHGNENFPQETEVKQSADNARTAEQAPISITWTTIFWLIHF